MNQVSGQILVKETGEGIPNLIVVLYAIPAEEKLPEEVHSEHLLTVH